MMDKLEHITGKVVTHGAVLLVPNGENLYVQTGDAIYRVNRDISTLTMTSEEFLSNYAVKIADTNTISRKWIWPDGNGGMYYFMVNNSSSHEIIHWDGNKNSSVYTSENDMFYLRYDSSAETMFIGYDRLRSVVYRIAALTKNSAGNFTFTKEFGTTVIYGKNLGSITTMIYIIIHNVGKRFSAKPSLYFLTALSV